jgi:hypothetical protein
MKIKKGLSLAIVISSLSLMLGIAGAWAQDFGKGLEAFNKGDYKIAFQQ